jgi:L-ribulose-5-phosphate 4-epimerase
MKNQKKVIKECINQNKLLKKKNLTLQTFSNVSIRLNEKYFTIKPSGVMPEDIAESRCPIIRISDGKKISGSYKPSTDTPTHRVLYKKYNEINSIAHTHSKYVTAWAQSGKSIPIYGTTHADYWKSEIPVTNFISQKKLKKNYEANTGNLIIKTIQKKKLKPFDCPGIIVAGHGGFSWGLNNIDAVKISELMEFIAELAYFTEQIKIKKKLPKYINKKHFERKFGKKSYYGQKF